MISPTSEIKPIPKIAAMAAPTIERMRTVLSEVFGARFVQPLLDEARALGLSPEDLVTLVRERADAPAPAPSPASAPATTPMEGLER